MGGNSVKIFHEAVGEKNGCGIGFETEGKIMKEIVGQVLGARADFEDGDNFVDGQVATQTQVMDCLWGWVSEIDGEVRGAENSAEFIELDDGDG